MIKGGQDCWRYEIPLDQIDIIPQRMEIKIKIK